MAGAGVVARVADIRELRRDADARRGQVRVRQRDRLGHIGRLDSELLREGGRRGTDLLARGLLILVAPAPVLAPTIAHRGESMRPRSRVAASAPPSID